MVLCTVDPHISKLDGTEPSLDMWNFRMIALDASSNCCTALVAAIFLALVHEGMLILSWFSRNLMMLPSLVIGLDPGSMNRFSMSCPGSASFGLTCLKYWSTFVFRVGSITSFAVPSLAVLWLATSTFLQINKNTHSIFVRDCQHAQTQFELSLKTWEPTRKDRARARARASAWAGACRKMFGSV